MVLRPRRRLHFLAVLFAVIVISYIAVVGSPRWSASKLACSSSCSSSSCSSSTSFSQLTTSSQLHALEEDDGSRASRTSRAACSEGQPSNIVFIKVHKSGSSTVANILARYALYHDLNVALPKKSSNLSRFNYFDQLHEDRVMALSQGQQYGVLFNHMIYNRSALDQLMPAGIYYCGIMREPLSRFLSGAKYYHYLLPASVKEYLLQEVEATNKTWGKAQAREQGAGTAAVTSEHLEGLAKLLNKTVKKKMERLPELYNSLASDSGLPTKDHMNEAAVLEHTRKLDRELDLMMVMEHFNESLVLLKRRACLSMKDIVYFPLNSAPKRRIRPLSPSDMDVLRAWQTADHKMYDYFYRKFKEEVLKEGSGFRQEVTHFTQILQDTKRFCDAVLRGGADVLVVKASPWNEEFTLNLEDCRLMQMQELDFQKRLIDRALRRLKGP